MGDEPAPFRYSVRVNWSDCDPAAIVFTGRIPYFSLEAIDAWWQEYTGVEWFELNIDRNIGTPFVHLSMNFSAPVTPRHRLICEVSLLHIGNSSIRHRVRGFQDGTLCFEGEFVSAFVTTDTMKSRKPPAEMLAAIRPLLVRE